MLGDIETGSNTIAAVSDNMIFNQSLFHEVSNF